MASYIRQKPPRWFVPVAILVLAWQLIGCWAFYQYAVAGPADAYQRQLTAAMPGWYQGVFAVAVLGGALGGLALLMRSKLAQPLFIVSFVAVLVQYGYVFATTDVIAHQGLFGAVGLPAFIAIVAAIEIRFAGHARRRGWIA